MVMTSSLGDVMLTGEISHFSWKLIGVTLKHITIELDWYKLTKNQVVIISITVSALWQKNDKKF